MTKNMGAVDRVVRTILVLGIIVLLITGQIKGALAVILGIVAAAFLLTGLTGSCPLYIPLRISTREKATQQT